MVVGSPGCMGIGRKQPSWSKSKAPVSEDNISLGMLRNIDIEIADAEHTDFADVFWPMEKAQFDALQLFGTNYALAGKDAVHPGWAGHTIMAYAFLKALDVPGDIGTFTVDLSGNKAKASEGHAILSCHDGVVTIESRRYPFCATGAFDSDNSIRSGMTLVPFNQDLNRLMLVVKHAKAKTYTKSLGAKTPAITPPLISLKASTLRMIFRSIRSPARLTQWTTRWQRNKPLRLTK